MNAPDHPHRGIPLSESRTPLEFGDEEDEINWSHLIDTNKPPQIEVSSQNDWSTTILIWTTGIFLAYLFWRTFSS